MSASSTLLSRRRYRSTMAVSPECPSDCWLLEKEAESLTQAARYERSEARHGYRSGHYDRNLTTTSGNVTLHMPRLKGMSFETAIIERYRRRESSVEEALIEMYLAGISVRRVEDITEEIGRASCRERV